MKKVRLIAFLALIAMTLSVFNLGVSADADWAEFLNFDGVEEAVPEGNLLTTGSFDDESCITYWNPRTQKLDHISSSTGGYLRMYEITSPIVAFDYTHDKTVAAGTYKFTGYFRTSYEGEVTELRFYLYDKNHGTNVREGAALVYVYPTSDKWLKVEFYVAFDSDFTGMRIAGGPYPEFIQSYCIDNFSLVKVDSIPNGYTRPTSFGTTVTYQEAEASNNGSTVEYSEFDPELESQYEVQGIVYNRDIDFIGTCTATTTEQDLKNYVYGFRDTHITDFMINIFCQIATYPSEVASDFIDKYNYYKAHGLAITDNRMTMAYTLFECKNIDYIDIFCQTFPEIGINPWLSFRMNDAHGVSNADGVVAWDFFTENPQYRRVQHGSTTNTYYDNLFDFSHEAVRQNVLAVINEALSMYDCYGIELDYQRDIWLWHTGGEYDGLDILNEYMHEIERVVSIYEDKYGHEIKIAVRCASDIQTNYDLGLDVITWASEGIIDLINPTARWATTDFDIPVKAWVSVMSPYGVEVAPGIEYLVQTYPGVDRGYHTIDTMCAAAASWFSQGADKIYLYNQFIGLPGIKDEDRVSGSDTGHFNMITTIGSYEKVINHDRLMMITYNDIAPLWKGVSADLPFRVAANNTGSIRIPLGDIPEGATVTLRMASTSLNLKSVPTVYINGVQAQHIGNTYEPNGYTKEKFLNYEVPASVLDDMFLIVELTPQKYFSSNYIDILIEVAK